MRDELLFHFERELTYLRYLSADFARKYPKVAGRLLLEDSGKSEDPHVARLMESFAFIAARIHTKLDDEFPEIIESLFTIVYPHYLRPMPSASIVQLQLDPEQGRLTSGLAGTERFCAVLCAGEWRAVQIPHLLRNDAVAY